MKITGVDPTAATIQPSAVDLELLRFGMQAGEEKAFAAGEYDRAAALAALEALFEAAEQLISAAADRDAWMYAVQDMMQKAGAPRAGTD